MPLRRKGVAAKPRPQADASRIAMPAALIPARPNAYGVQQGKLPGAWAFFYEMLYARRRDRFIAWTGITVAFAVLVLGRVHAIGVGVLDETLSSINVSLWGVVVLSLFILFLVIFAWIGDFVKSNALDTIDSHAAELRGFINVIVSESSLAASDNTDPRLDTLCATSSAHYVPHQRGDGFLRITHIEWETVQRQIVIDESEPE
ncbi:MAG: hypothetical protein OXG35_30850 [Acidobacteria bacterium]|nr:hypothetical protein [Acidobacteriota bacterium]